VSSRVDGQSVTHEDLRAVRSTHTTRNVTHSERTIRGSAVHIDLHKSDRHSPVYFATPPGICHRQAPAFQTVPPVTVPSLSAPLRLAGQDRKPSVKLKALRLFTAYETRAGERLPSKDERYTNNYHIIKINVISIFRMSETGDCRYSVNWCVGTRLIFPLLLFHLFC
jgi:hypothetical protein